MRKNYVAFQCEQEELEKIKQFAKSQHLTKSDILRRAIREFNEKNNSYVLTK